MRPPPQKPLVKGEKFIHSEGKLILLKTMSHHPVFRIFHPFRFPAQPFLS